MHSKISNKLVARGFETLIPCEVFAHDWFIYTYLSAISCWLSGLLVNFVRTEADCCCLPFLHLQVLLMLLTWRTAYCLDSKWGHGVSCSVHVGMNSYTSIFINSATSFIYWISFTFVDSFIKYSYIHNPYCNCILVWILNYYGYLIITTLY